jgi:hypothetical protein
MLKVSLVRQPRTTSTEGFSSRKVCIFIQSTILATWSLTFLLKGSLIVANAWYHDFPSRFWCSSNKISGQSYTTQRCTQTQKDSIPSVFSTKMGASETTRRRRCFLALVRGYVLVVTLWKQRSSSLCRPCCLYLISRKLGMRMVTKSLSKLQ